MECSSRLLSSDLPHPNGSLLASVKEANKAVKSVMSLRERASREEVTLNSNLSSKLQLAGMPFYTTTKQLFGTSLSSWV